MFHHSFALGWGIEQAASYRRCLTGQPRSGGAHNLHVVTSIWTAGSIHVMDGSVEAAVASRTSCAQMTAPTRTNDSAVDWGRAHRIFKAESVVAEHAARRSREANRKCGFYRTESPVIYSGRVDLA